jgi:hypothetical protein
MKQRVERAAVRANATSAEPVEQGGIRHTTLDTSRPSLTNDGGPDSDTTEKNSPSAVAPLRLDQTGSDVSPDSTHGSDLLENIWEKLKELENYNKKLTEKVEKVSF